MNISLRTTVVLSLMLFFCSVHAKDRISSGETLLPGQSLVSASGSTRLVMQEDGNLVLYSDAGNVLWHTHTYGQPGNYLAMQGDGNLVIYSEDRKPKWNSETARTPGNIFVVQNDQNLVIYGPVNGQSKAIWSHESGRIYQPDPAQDGSDRILPGQTLYPGQKLLSNNGDFRLSMQYDGNLVVYTKDGKATWNSGTNGNSDAYAVFQTDGNLVIRSSSSSLLWATGTDGTSATAAYMQSDGNFVVYEGNTAVWSSFHGLVRPSLPTSPSGLLQLPASGTGFGTYLERNFQWGKPSLVYGLMTAARKRHNSDPSLPNVMIGHLSLSDGGNGGRHQSHTNGRYADIRPISNSSYNGPLTITDANYSSTRTKAWAQLLVDDFGADLQTFFFNDSNIYNSIPIVSPLSGHSNHMHISIR